ncbi:hypothetical protein BP00DRAFT_428715 [Aspergillus indologenus CBS 114.80]|uniref:Uncharacterized protein n=1 Tax=Aspergillus indologenus CBS 114.80 TaxID=1450541 RepID=A0A2V5HUM4_9EURO|nr:hypothetical protein BP00DRAFT_428715 [Aspergillus indologenus CBS 114.80]
MTAEHEVGGPLGAAAIVSGLSLRIYRFASGYNEIVGCPVPSLLSQRANDTDVKADTGPQDLSIGKLPNGEASLLSTVARFF